MIIKTIFKDLKVKRVKKVKRVRYYVSKCNAVKPLNSEHLRFLKNLSVIERCPLLGGNLKKIVTFGTKRFVRYSRHVRYLECPLLGGFTVYICISWYSKICWFPMKKCWCQCAKFHHCRICVTGFTKKAFLFSRFLWAATKRPMWIGLS